MFAPVPSWAVTEVLLSDDLIPSLFASLNCNDCAASAVCKAWRRLLDTEQSLWCRLCQAAWSRREHVPQALRVLAAGSAAGKGKVGNNNRRGEPPRAREGGVRFRECRAGKSAPRAPGRVPPPVRCGGGPRPQASLSLWPGVVNPFAVLFRVSNKSST